MTRWLRTTLPALVLGAALATALAAAAAPAPAAAKRLAPIPVIGIGEQTPALFGSPYWQALGLEDVRVVAAWDALRYTWARDDLDAYMTAAHASGARVLLGFGHSRTAKGAKRLPTVAEYVKAFKGFRARYPWVKDFIAWNEANHCSQPTCRNPEQAARFYNAIRGRCRGCRIVAADVLDTTNMVRWITRFRHVAKGRIIWGLHNYIDANRGRTTGTRALLKAVKGDVWFTETGGIVARNWTSPIKLPDSARHAATATRFLLDRLIAISPRIKRVYVYEWAPSKEPLPAWDSALTDLLGRPRPAYGVLQRWLARHAGAAHR